MNATLGAEEFAQRTRGKITRRLIPFLFILYIISYLDRVNLSYAGLAMTKELGFSEEVFGFGAGIFFLGYVLLEVPGTILVELWSARKWISRIMVTWGLVAALTGLIHTRTEFYWARFILGVAEAGFFPGVVVYLSHWFRKQDRAKAVAGFMAAIPVSQILGSPISAALSTIHWLNLPGWRWLLILEGIPAIIFGVITLYYLTDRPSQAKWLTPEERQWIEGELESERAEVKKHHGQGLLQAFLRPEVIVLTLIYFLSANVSYGLTLWLPKMLQRLSGFNQYIVILLSAIPFLLTWPFMLAVGRSSDRMQERRWHLACSLWLGAVGLGVAALTNNVALGIVGFTLAAMGINARLGPFWALPNEFLAGTSAAAVVGTINCIGNIGGFVGPSMVGWLTKRTGNYTAGLVYLVGAAAVAGALIFVVKPRGARNIAGKPL